MRTVSRRELLADVARWSVPTVVTITLGARVLEAKASCPPCQKKVAGVCRACTVGQILNCQCEPCLGPPYCSAVGPVAPAMPSRSGGALTSPYSQTGLTGAPGSQPTAPGSPYGTPRGGLRSAPFTRPLYRDPFGLERSGFGARTPESQGLYQRLRPDTLSPRRLP